MPAFRSIPWVAAGLLVLALLMAGAERELLIPSATALIAQSVLCAAGLGLLVVSEVSRLARRRSDAVLALARRLSLGFAEGVENAESLALSTVDRTGLVRSFNLGATALFGYRPEEIIGRPVAGAIGLEPTEFLTELNHVFESGRSHPARRTLVADRKGRKFEALAVMFPIRGGGRVSEVGLLHLDPRLAEGAEGARARLFDSAPVGLLRIDPQGRIQAVNRRLCDWTGRRCDALEGADAARSDVLPEALRTRLAAASGDAPSFSPQEEEVMLVSPDGVPRPYLAILAPRPGGGADAVLLDGTTRQRLRAELEAARSALAVAREAAAETIQSTHRDLTTSVSALMTAFETARDEKTGPILRAEAEKEIEKSGRRLLAQVADAGALPRRGDAAAPDGGKARRPRVLLVDDNDENRDLIAHMLTSRGADVVSRGSGREAVDVAARSHFDLVLLDVQMPEMDGYEVVRRLRSLPGGHELPVVALTALTSDAIRDRCVAEGMDDFLSKPVTLAAIGELLARWGRTRRSDGRDFGEHFPREG